MKPAGWGSAFIRILLHRRPPRAFRGRASSCWISVKGGGRTAMSLAKCSVVFACGKLTTTESLASMKAIA